MIVRRRDGKHMLNEGLTPLQGCTATQKKEPRGAALRSLTGRRQTEWLATR